MKTTFRFADGRVEQRPHDPLVPVWRIAEGEHECLVDVCSPAKATMQILEFELVISGERWQISPERFDPFAALIRQDRELERIREGVRRMRRWVPYADGMIPVDHLTDKRKLRWVLADNLRALLGEDQ